MELIIKDKDEMVVINFEEEDTPDLLRISMLAEFLGISRQSLYKMAERKGWKETLFSHFLAKEMDHTKDVIDSL